MLDQLKPGQTVVCTIKARPSNAAEVKTLTRLMQMDPRVVKGLRKAQKRRRDEMKWKPRGGREWANRELVSDIVQVKVGESWSMTFVPHIASDLRSVEQWIDVKAG